MVVTMAKIPSRKRAVSTDLVLGCLAVTGLIVLSEIVSRRHLFWAAASSVTSTRVDELKRSPIESDAGHLPEEKSSLSFAILDPQNGLSDNRPNVETVTYPRFDATVVGTAFDVSPSVDARCKDFLNCNEVRKKLAIMAGESRDPSWATQMETKLQDAVMLEGPDKYLVRNVECRASICALEVASLFGPYLGPHFGDPLNDSLWDGIETIWSYEFGANGVRTTVTLKLFTRR